MVEGRNSEEMLLTGNEAIARGFYEAGGAIAASYPGSPTMDILETVKKLYTDRGTYAEYSVNEKVAVEVAIGGSIAGARSMAVMKHVGVNIAMDPLMSFTQAKISGGFMLVVGDDPGMTSSQNEQDSRVLGKFAKMVVLDPADSQDAKDFAKLSFSLSEQFDAPVMLRILSRLCHSRSKVRLESPEDVKVSGFTAGPEQYNMIPPNTFVMQYGMAERIEKLSEYANTAKINKLEEGNPDGDTLIVTSGIVYQNLKELGGNFNILKLGMVYPLPVEKIRELQKKYPNILVIEELTPLIEEELKMNGISCEGKRYFPFTGEIHIEVVKDGLQKAGLLDIEQSETAGPVDTVSRVPLFCAGCPHRPVFDILKKSKVKIVGDIGCYSMACLPPLEVYTSIISIGAGVGIMKGMQKAFTIAGNPEPLVAVIGDSTFFHSGMTGILNLTHQLDEKNNMTLIVLNNAVTAMTGGQLTPTSGRYTEDSDMNTDIEALVKSMGIERIRTVDQFDYGEAKKVIKEEIEYSGLSIIIVTRPCALYYKVKEQPYEVDPEICISCRSCVKTNCPPISMKKYDGIDKLKSYIDPEMCVGCSVCSQVCPVHAIKLKGEKR